MNHLEYMKIAIEDKESACIAQHFSKVYDFIEGAFNEQRTKQSSLSLRNEALLDDFCKGKKTKPDEKTNKDFHRKTFKTVEIDFVNQTCIVGGGNEIG